jgi:hypothetical protein
LQRITVVFSEEYCSRPSAFGPASREDWPLRACKSGTTLNSERRAPGQPAFNHKQGNLHSHTMRAFTAAEMTKILERVA